MRSREFVMLPSISDSLDCPIDRRTLTPLTLAVELVAHGVSPVKVAAYLRRYPLQASPTQKDWLSGFYGE